MPKIAPRRVARVPRMLPSDDAEGALGYTRPRTYEELRALLSSATVRLPRQLREVALYVARNPSDFALGNTIEISKRARVQPSTLVRFAQALGFPGFSELQDIFKDYVKMNWPETGRVDPLAEAVSADNPDLRIIAGLAQTSISSLSRVPDDIDLGMFETIASGLAAAATIYLLGSKRAFPVTMYMAIALSQLGIRNCLVDNVGSLGFEQLGFAGADDAVPGGQLQPIQFDYADACGTRRPVRGRRLRDHGFRRQPARGFVPRLDRHQRAGLRRFPIPGRGRSHSEWRSCSGSPDAGRSAEDLRNRPAENRAGRPARV